jgi:hypothetical protein
MSVFGTTRVRFVSSKISTREISRKSSLKTVARELGKYKLDLVAVQEVR